MSSNIMADLFRQLESTDSHLVDEIKQKFHEQFNLVQDSWLLYGLYDYYVSSNSARSIEILVNIREPHHQYLFNKLAEALKTARNESRVQALTLFGHVLRKQPPWLYKVTEHPFLKDLLKLLKTETDILLLLSALLVLIVLLPIVPARMGLFLQDVFEIFSRLAAWNCSNPERLIEEQMIHMQVALYALFQRLYGMYPCNFLAYLRNQYRTKDQTPIFVHTVKPMLGTVKMHPSLVTASKDKETTTERWKKMGSHDVVVECERFSLEVADRCPHECGYLTSSFRSRSGTTNSATYETSYQLPSLKLTSITSLGVDAKDFFSATGKIYVQTPPPLPDVSAPTPIPHPQGTLVVAAATAAVAGHEGTSPPETAIEATPETTPIKDVRGATTSRLPAATASAVRALNTLGGRNWSVGSSTGSTPNHSQPSSPMRKDVALFNFPSDNRMSAFGLPRQETYAAQKLQRIMLDRSQATTEGDLNLQNTHHHQPTSPLRIISASDSSSSNVVQRIESPISQEDEEVLAIVRQGQLEARPDLRQCDSVLQEVEGGRGTEDDLDECEQEHGSPCTAGGLHMPNSRSMNDFAKRVRRLRYHSQSGIEPAATFLPETSTGSSPGNYAPFTSNTVRRANSCPEMKKSPVVVPPKDDRNKTLMEADEETNDTTAGNKQKCLVTSETQTENFWPMPYEHLFLGVFPSLEGGDVKPSPAPSPAPYNLQLDKFATVSPYEILDKYIMGIVVQSNERDQIKCVKEQLQLLHQQLMFERHRRETHAFKNRRLLADAKNTKALEEHNSALRDQVQLQQLDIDNLKEQLEQIKREQHSRGRKGSESASHWEKKFIALQQECKVLKRQNEHLQGELEAITDTCTELDAKWQIAEAALLDAVAEVKIAKEQLWAGEKGKAELEQVNKQLLLAGEIQMRYQEKLAQLALLRSAEQRSTHFTAAYNNELRTLRESLDAKTAKLEACKVRITELEQTVIQNDEFSSKQKRILSEVKEEYDERLKAVESKYQTQLIINRSLEEKVLDLWQRIEVATRRPIHSPDTSSCHEVIPTLTDKTSIATGLSPHSSPLSASLASSEGSIAFGHSDMKEMKNLQYMFEPIPSTSKSGTLEETDLTTESETSHSVPSTPKQD